MEEDDDYDDGDFDWSDWIPCEVYGHNFNEDGWCPDCDTYNN